METQTGLFAFLGADMGITVLAVAALLAFVPGRHSDLPEQVAVLERNSVVHWEADHTERRYERKVSLQQWIVWASFGDGGGRGDRGPGAGAAGVSAQGVSRVEPMKLKRVFRRDGALIRLFRLMWTKGRVGDGNGYSCKLTLGLYPCPFSWRSSGDEWFLYLGGLRIHFQRSWGGIHV